MNRRDFVKNSGLIGLGVFATQFPAWSTSIFGWQQPVHNIPVEKNIDAAWLSSLYERGESIKYRKSKNELRYIGMPVGGLHAGTVYIGGDGRLWLWQIYNETYEETKEGIETKTVKWNNGKEQVNIRPRDGAAYIEPAIADNLRILEQGFAISVNYNGKQWVKELREDHWDEITFEPSYPICKVTYSSESFPVEVVMTAFSPFIPLNADNSALPLTSFHLDIKNKTPQSLEVIISGWLENGVHKNRKDYDTVRKVATARPMKNAQSILFTCDLVPDKDLQDGDNGTMGLFCNTSEAVAACNVPSWPIAPIQLMKTVNNNNVSFADLQVGSLSVKREIQPTDTTSVSYAVSWHFNNPHPKLRERLKDAQEGYWYGKRFEDAHAVLRYYNENNEFLNKTTLQWAKAWNDSTLPHWFLDRTFVNIGTLATANTYRFNSGRFWGWEGVGACAGTCTHVWQYGQAMGRIFPELEQNLRETTDLGVGFRPESGAIIFRAEYEHRPAIDGQAGVILRFYRDHQMSRDSTFLKRNWTNLKKAIQFLIDQDKNGDGMTDTPMENTLDAIWEGEIAWIVGLSLAAIKAGAYMAEEVGDKDFQQRCTAYVHLGSVNMDKELFNGEYYIHRPDKVSGRTKLGSYNTCHIDQVYGQAWTFQLGMSRINEKQKTLSALKALWDYNFTMDVGPYIKTHLNGRPYALPGDGGMVMNTNPKNEAKAYGNNETWQLGYFHECMSGFEHQVAAHMMAEGMTDESLILTRVIHDRYHAARRNPFNEIECSDHYARAMASYGTFISACGYEYHGPKKYLAFAPRITAEEFKAAYTTASAWGSYAQKQNAGKNESILSVIYGDLPLHTFGIGKPKGLNLEKSQLKVLLNDRLINVSEVYNDEEKVKLSFKEELLLKEGDLLKIMWS
ncbi:MULTISPECIES: GH116 family glycosyl hydrolase [unclassified Sphingobacterium]|uniref:GH116 family glycosyl hydrolase n=1 Tax=unclassified Sphingobacterium TaxID=2609468 RepID=UPI0025D837B4|nr:MULTISPECIES: GH116 family glycosyl-hydrolase [unclassified Sphingobacterium]